jgi:hypothetical protein
LQDVTVAVLRRQKLLELERKGAVRAPPAQDALSTEELVALEELLRDPLAGAHVDEAPQPEGPPGGAAPISGASEPQAEGRAPRGLPYGGRIAAALGIDLSAVRVVGGDAARALTREHDALGAAQGATVWLPPGADLFTVAHEVAHAVQALYGAMPRAGQDVGPWERHADAVARAVVSGSDATPLLARLPQGGSALGTSSDAGAAGAWAPSSAVMWKGAAADTSGRDAPPARKTDGGASMKKNPTPGGREKAKAEEEARRREAANQAATAATSKKASAPPKSKNKAEAPRARAAGRGVDPKEAPAPAKADLGPGQRASRKEVAAPAKSASEAMSQFGAMAPSKQASSYKAITPGVQGGATATREHASAQVPELHAKQAEEPLPAGVGGDDKALHGKTSVGKQGAAQAKRQEDPEHSAAEPPAVGGVPFDASAIAGWLSGQGGSDAKDAKKIALHKAQEGGKDIATQPVPPEIKLEGKADTQQADDAHAKATEDAGKAAVEAKQQVFDGPGPDSVRLAKLDVPFEAPKLPEIEVPEFAQAVPGMDKFESYDLPANVQAEFDSHYAPQLQAHVDAATEQAKEAEGKFEADKDAQIAEAERGVDEANADAQAQQEAAVHKARGDIQASRRTALEKQDAAVADVKKEADAERTKTLGDIDKQVRAEKGTIDREMRQAQRKADAEVTSGERKAREEEKKADSKDDSFWDDVVDAVSDFVEGLVEAITAIWEAVRDAVSKILDAAVALANKIIDGIIKFVSAALSAYLDLLTSLVGALLGELFPEIAAWLTEKLQQFKNWAVQKLQELGKFLKEQVKAFAEKLKAGLDALVQGYLNAIKAAATFLEACITGDWDKVLSMTIDAIFWAAGIDRKEFEEKYGPAEAVFEAVIADPSLLVKNAVDATALGFSQFGDNFGKHFGEGAIEWLTGGTGITLPGAFDLKGVFSIVLQVLGINKEFIKGKVEKYAGSKAATVFDYVWDYVAAFMDGGVEGVWELVKDQLTGLWDMVLGQIVSFVTEKAIKRAVQFIATVATGYGAIVEAVIALWNFGTWVYDNIQRIMGIVQTVLKSTIDFVAGNIQPAADKIESLLGNLIPVALDLVAKMLGFGDLPEKSRDLIKGVRDRVDKAIDNVIEKTIARFKGGKGDDKGKEAGDVAQPAGDDGAFDGEIGEKIAFAAGGEGHHLWIATSGGAPAVMVASTPMTLEARIQDWDKRLKTVGKEGGATLAEGYDTAKVASILSTLGQTVGVATQHANKTLSLLEKQKAAKGGNKGGTNEAKDSTAQVQAADTATEKAERDLVKWVTQMFEAFGENGGDHGAVLEAQVLKATLETKNFATFASTMAEMGLAPAAEEIWLHTVRQLFQSEDQYKKATDAKTARIKLADAGFKKLVNEFQVPDKILKAFEAQTGKMKGKRVALWSGRPAKGAAATSGKADVFLEGTPLGQAFDKSGLPKEVPATMVLWAAISKAYAKHLAANVKRVSFVGFVGHDTPASGNIAAEIELPEVMTAIEAEKKSITWMGAATKDGSGWANEILSANGKVLTEQKGFWAVGGDRAQVVAESAEKWKLYEAFETDAHAKAVEAKDAEPKSFTDKVKEKGNKLLQKIGLGKSDAAIDIGKMVAATGAADASIVDDLVASSVEKDGKPVAADAVKTAKPVALVQFGRQLWRDRAGSDRAWLEAAVKKLDGGAHKGRWEELLNKAESKEEASVTYQQIDKFASAVWTRFRAVVGTPSEFTGIFNEQLGALGLMASAKEKSLVQKYLPKISVGPTDWFKAEYQVDNGKGSKSSALFEHKFEDQKMGEEVVKGFSDDLAERFNLKTPVPTLFGEATVGVEISPVTVGGAVKGDVSRTVSDASTVLTVSATASGSAKTGAKGTAKFDVAPLLPWLPLLTVTGEVGVDGSVGLSGTAGFKWEKKKSADKAEPWVSTGGFEFTPELAFNTSVKIEALPVLGKLKALWGTVKGAFDGLKAKAEGAAPKNDLGGKAKDAIHKLELPPEPTKSFKMLGDTIEVGIDKLVPFVKVDVAGVKFSGKGTIGWKNTKVGDDRLFVNPDPRFKGKVEPSGILAELYKRVFGRKESEELIDVTKELAAKVKAAEAKVEEIKGKLASAEKDHSEKSEKLEDLRDAHGVEEGETKTKKQADQALDLARARRSKLQNRIETSGENLVKIRAQIGSEKASRQADPEKIKALEARATELEASIAKARQELPQAEQELELARAERDVVQAEKTVGNLKAELEVARKERTQAENLKVGDVLDQREAEAKKRAALSGNEDAKGDKAGSYTTKGTEKIGKVKQGTAGGKPAGQPVQADNGFAGGQPDTSQAQEAFSGTASALPFGSTIQASFGDHDISGVKAHTGGAAQAQTSAMGAGAFASGQNVAFGQAPDLHTAAHEAAHVVQQQAGLAPAGGVGRAGDAFEKNADAAADAVVAGESAADVLDSFVGSGGSAASGASTSGGGAVQANTGDVDAAAGKGVDSGPAKAGGKGDEVAAVAMTGSQYAKIQAEFVVPLPYGALNSAAVAVSASVDVAAGGKATDAGDLGLVGEVKIEFEWLRATIGNSLLQVGINAFGEGKVKGSKGKLLLAEAAAAAGLGAKGAQAVGAKTSNLAKASGLITAGGHAAKLIGEEVSNYYGMGNVKKAMAPLADVAARKKELKAKAEKLIGEAMGAAQGDVIPTLKNLLFGKTNDRLKSEVDAVVQSYTKQLVAGSVSPEEAEKLVSTAFNLPQWDNVHSIFGDLLEATGSPEEKQVAFGALAGLISQIDGDSNGLEKQIADIVADKSKNNQDVEFKGTVGFVLALAGPVSTPVGKIAGSVTVGKKVSDGGGENFKEGSETAARLVVSDTLKTEPEVGMEARVDYVWGSVKGEGPNAKRTDQLDLRMSFDFVQKDPPADAEAALGKVGAALGDLQKGLLVILQAANTTAISGLASVAALIMDYQRGSSAAFDGLKSQYADARNSVWKGVGGLAPKFKSSNKVQLRFSLGFTNVLSGADVSKDLLGGDISLSKFDASLAVEESASVGVENKALGLGAEIKGSVGNRFKLEHTKEKPKKQDQAAPKEAKDGPSSPAGSATEAGERSKTPTETKSENAQAAKATPDKEGGPSAAGSAVGADEAKPPTNPKKKKKRQAKKDAKKAANKADTGDMDTSEKAAP